MPRPRPAATWEPVDSLSPWPRNPRDHAKSLPVIIESIRRAAGPDRPIEEGFGPPLVARKSDRMICIGNGRWKAARHLGMKEVPVRFLELTDEQAEGLALIDNASARLAEDDESILDELLAELGPLPGFEARRDDESLERLLAVDESFDAPVADEFYVVIRGPLAEQLAVLSAVESATKTSRVISGTIER